MRAGHKLPHHNRKRLITLIVLALGLYIILPQIAGFKTSLSLIRHISVVPLLLAIVFIAFTFLLAAATYHCLARHPLVYRRTVLVALANMFTNRLLPAGAGSIATFFIYLRQRRHTVSQAGSVVAVNNFLGFFSHICLLLGLLLLSPASFDGFTLPRIDPLLVVAIIMFAVILGVFLILKKSMHKIINLFARSIVRDLGFYARYPIRLGAAFTTSLLLTLANAAALWLCVLAVHVTISPVAALAVFTIGIVVGTATPTPGGLGGTEAGLLAGLIGFSIAGPQALAAVILYRLISYWLTLAMGIIAYLYIDHRGYLRAFTR